MCEYMSEMIYQYPDRYIEEIKVNSALRDRKIYFNESVTRESVFKVIHILDRLVQLDKQQGTKEDIELVLDCEGGSVYFGLALASKLLYLRDKLGYNIICTVNSIAMSMGSIFLICTSHRRALNYATIMIHQISSATWNTLQEMEDDVEETNRLWNNLKEIIISNTKITDEMLEKVKRERKDWYIDANLALELGLIHEIL